MPARHDKEFLMNRFLKPVLAAGTLLTLAVPALASAQSYDGGRVHYGDRAYYADRGDYARSYQGDYGRDDRHGGWRRDFGYRHDWRARYWGHRHYRRDDWRGAGWR